MSHDFFSLGLFVDFVLLLLCFVPFGFMILIKLSGSQKKVPKEPSMKVKMVEAA